MELYYKPKNIKVRVFFKEMCILRQRLNKRINRLFTRFYTLKKVLGISAKKDRI
jgi:hypothetical protein